jgi:uncharacterized membrane protein YhaH (DUF805 family)
MKGDKKMNEVIKKFFSFEDRISRMQFFLYSLCLIPLYIFSYIISLDSTYTALAFCFLISTICIVSSISLSVRRLNDLNLSGWLVLIQYIYFIPVIKYFAIVFWLILMFVPGTFGGNSYGDDPLEAAY